MAGMCGAQGVVEFAGFLEFAPEEEDRFGCWGGGRGRELEVLCTRGQQDRKFPPVIPFRIMSEIPEHRFVDILHSDPTASKAPNHPV